MRLNAGLLACSTHVFLALACVTAAAAADSPSAEFEQDLESNMDHDELLKRIERVDPVHAQTMQNHPTSFETRDLSFYGDFHLVEAKVKLPHKPLVFRYADDGEQLLPLGGTPEHIYKVNSTADLQINDDTVGDYLKFFFANTGSGKFQIAEDAEDLKWNPKADQDSIVQAKQFIEPLEVTRVEGQKGYLVGATGAWEENLIKLWVSVTSTGKVDVHQQRVLLSDAPFVYRGR